MKEKQKEYFGPVIFGILLAFFSYRGALSQLQSILSDLNGHTYVYLPYYFRRESVLEAWSMAPYCMWHLLTLWVIKAWGSRWNMLRLIPMPSLLFLPMGSFAFLSDGSMYTGWERNPQPF